VDSSWNVRNGIPSAGKFPNMPFHMHPCDILTLYSTLKRAACATVQVCEDDGSQGYLSAYNKFQRDNPDLVRAQHAERLSGAVKSLILTVPATDLPLPAAADEKEAMLMEEDEGGDEDMVEEHEGEEEEETVNGVPLVSAPARQDTQVGNKL